MYIQLYLPYRCKDTDDLSTKIYALLNYDSDEETLGQIETLERRLENAQALLHNLLLLMNEKGMINEADFLKLQGRQGE